MFMPCTVLIMLTRPAGEGTKEALPTEPVIELATLDDITATALVVMVVETATETADDICCTYTGSGISVGGGGGGGGGGGDGGSGGSGGL